MALTPLRWIAGFVAGALLTIIVATASPSFRQLPYDRVERNLSRRVDTYSNHVATIVNRLRSRTRADSVVATASRLPPAPFRTVIDGAFPAQLRPDLQTLGARAQALVGGQPRLPVDMAFVYDTATRYMGQMFYLWGVTPTYIVPAKPGDRCTVIVRVGKDKIANQRMVLRGLGAPTRLLSLCAYYSAFGMPGPGVARWIHDAAWTFVGEGSWTVEPPPYVPYYSNIEYNGLLAMMGGGGPSLFTAIPLAGLTCLRGDTDSCRSIASAPVGYAPWNGNLLDQTVGLRTYRYIGYNAKTGDRSPMLLASLVRGLGREKFQTFWSSSDSVSGALKGASGKDLGTWTHDWMVASYGDEIVAGPSPRGWALSSALLLTALGIVVAIGVSRRRQYA